MSQKYVRSRLQYAEANMDDQKCLKEFVELGSQAAFARVVARHLDLVYSAALRQVRDHHLAEDVTQAAFAALAKKAHALRHETVLSAWLLVTTRFIALDQLKSRSRRQKHESKAAEMAQKTQRPDRDDRWDAISPHLDAALGSLNAQDRRAVTLRYFEDRSLHEVAATLGVSPASARQRVHRATVRMRAYFASRGVEVALASVGPAILAYAVRPAPHGVLAAAVAASKPAVSAGVIGGSKGAILVMASANTKLIGAAAIVLLLSAGAVVGYKVTRPSQPQVVIIGPAASTSPAPVPDSAWRERFNNVYELAEGQKVKFVAEPLIPERQSFWDNEQRRQGGRGWKLHKDEVFSMTWDGKEAHWASLSLSGGDLGQALQVAAKLHGWEIDSSIPIDMSFRGDWIFRKSATTAQVMDELGPIVSARLGKPVHFVQRLLPREVIVVRGAYHYAPLPGQLDGLIQFMGKPRGSEPTAPLRHTTLHEMIARIEGPTGRRVFDETADPSPQVAWIDHLRIDDSSVLLRNLTTQTSLHFDQEQRNLQVWCMSAGDGRSAVH